MTQVLQTAMVVLTVLGMLSSIAHASSYNDKILTHIAIQSDGTVFIKWAESPRPGPCGENFGWVKIPPTANEAIKALAISLYIGGKLARIDTSGCDGTYEIVTILYSPGG